MYSFIWHSIKELSLRPPDQILILIVDNRATEVSDVDLAIVSSAFAPMTPFERLVFLGKLAWELDLPEIEAIGYTPEEFFSAPAWEFPAEIQRQGKIIR